MNEEKLRYFAKKGFLLNPEIINLFVSFNDNDLSERILNQIFLISGNRIITKNTILNNFNQIKNFIWTTYPEKKEIFSAFFVNEIKLKKSLPVEINVELDKLKIVYPNFKILSSNIVSCKKIEVKDFVAHFRNRYVFFRDILKERKELNNLISIDKIGNNREFSMIAMVSKKRITKNKNIFIEVEDFTGKTTALINKDKEELFEKAKEIIPDDIVGLRCSGGKEMAFVNDIIFPEAHINEKKKLEEESYALFISDIHLGSIRFLEKNFLRFLNWLNGDCSDEQRKKIEKIGYIFITGDNVDGVGVYPGQEEMLSIKNVKDQYAKLAEYLKKIPKHIKIFLCAGQHDAVRLPEPQPPIDEEFGGEITKIDNLYLVSNPASIEIGCAKNKMGINVLVYHGASMHGWIDELESLRLEKANHNPSKIIKHILKHRHLSPIHSANVYIPSEKEDALIIKTVPDIIVTGDMHRTDVDMYNNILIICGSCWQSITPFEEKVGNIPDPCKIPMLNLKTREMKILDFSEEVTELNKIEEKT
jgi:DNA polymerase II small subunit